MRLTIDRQDVDPGLVTYNPGMGFGRFDSDTIEVHSYELFIDRADLVEQLSGTYRSACREMRADDEKYGDESDFKALGYADLDEAFDFPEELAEAIDTYFDRDILDVYVTCRERFVYVINSVDNVTVSPDGLLLEGRCFRHLEWTGNLPEPKTTSGR